MLGRALVLMRNRLDYQGPPIEQLLATRQAVRALHDGTPSILLSMSRGIQTATSQDETDQFCGLRDHPTSACTAIWGAPFTHNGVTRGTSCEMPVKRLRWQRATCFTSLRGTGILGAQIRIVCDGGPFQHMFEAISNWPEAVLVPANKFFIRIYVICVHFFPRSSPLAYLANVALATMCIYTDRFFSVISVEHGSYVQGT